METERVSLCRQDLLAWASDSLAFYGLDLSRISTVLLDQVYTCEANRIFNTFDLTNPIKVLEGHREFDGTLPEDQFRHSPLTGLYKKHFTSPRFLAKNLLNFLQSKPGQRHFNLAWKKAADISTSGVSDEKFIGYMVHQMVVPPVQIKSASSTMTGEWVVFHRHEGQNYYLTLASHAESNEEIHNRVVLASRFETWPFTL
jgi:hypothetical protein